MPPVPFKTPMAPLGGQEWEGSPGDLGAPPRPGKREWSSELLASQPHPALFSSRSCLSFWLSRTEWLLQQACRVHVSRGQEGGKGHPLSWHSAHPQPPFCFTAAAQAGRAACATNASPTMAVAMALAASPGNVPVMRAGEASSVTRVSEGKDGMWRRRERWARGGN